jgi:hypothetical protein
VGDPNPPVSIVYTNWRGETATRRIRPIGVHYGATEWHSEPQWLLRAFDFDRGAVRDFALGGIGHASGDLLRHLLTTLPADVVEAELRRCGHAPKSAVLAMIDAVEMLEDLDVALAGLTGEPVGEVDDGQDDQE